MRSCGVAAVDAGVSQIDWKVVLHGKADAESKLKCMETTRKNCL